MIAVVHAISTARYVSNGKKLYRTTRRDTHSQLAYVVNLSASKNVQTISRRQPAAAHLSVPRRRCRYSHGNGRWQGEVCAGRCGWRRGSNEIVQYFRDNWLTFGAKYGKGPTRKHTPRANVSLRNVQNHDIGTRRPVETGHTWQAPCWGKISDCGQSVAATGVSCGNFDEE